MDPSATATATSTSTAMDSQLRIHELCDEDEMYIQPADHKIKLWPHQRTLVARCIKYETDKIKPSEFSHINARTTVHADDYVHTRVGVICDSVGSGKSFAILALVMARDAGNGLNDANKTVTIKSYGSNKVLLSFTEVHNPIKTSVLVIPHVLVSQWTNYIKNFSDTMRSVVISRQKHVAAFIETTLPQLDETDLVVVTSSFYNAVARPITRANLRVQRVIFDEVDNMNLPNCLPINSHFHWFVSASYANLLFPRGNYQYDHTAHRTVWYASGLRNSGFVKNVFTDLSYNLPLDYFKILFVRNRDRYVQDSINLPDPITTTIQCATPAEIRILRGFADDDVIQCLNARDIAAALRVANPRQMNSEDNLIGLHISRFIKDLHNVNMRLELTKSLEYDDETTRQADLQRLQEKKVELQTRMTGIQERIRSCNTCCICYDDIQLKTVAPCCSNAFCFACLTRWLAKTHTCPLCKSTILCSNLMTVTNGEGSSGSASTETEAAPAEVVEWTSLHPSHDKMKNLRALLVSHIDPSTAKVLIFSSYDFTNAQIDAALTYTPDETVPGIGETDAEQRKREEREERNAEQAKILSRYRYKSLKGNEGHINQLVSAYRRTSPTSNDTVLNMLLVNARHFGSGINLENTTDIIMFHKLDSELEKQVIGRAQRFGRTSPLNIWYLLHDNEMPSVVTVPATTATAT